MSSIWEMSAATLTDADWALMKYRCRIDPEEGESDICKIFPMSLKSHVSTIHGFNLYHGADNRTQVSSAVREKDPH